MLQWLTVGVKKTLQLVASTKGLTSGLFQPGKLFEMDAEADTLTACALTLFFPCHHRRGCSTR